MLNACLSEGDVVGQAKSIFKIRKLGFALRRGEEGIQRCSYRRSLGPPPPGKQRPDRTPRNPAGVWVECYFEAGGPGFKTRSSSTPNCNSRETYVINRPAERGERERHRDGERGATARERGQRERHSHREIERRERK